MLRINIKILHNMQSAAAAMPQKFSDMLAALKTDARKQAQGFTFVGQEIKAAPAAMKAFAEALSRLGSSHASGTSRPTGFEGRARAPYSFSSAEGTSFKSWTQDGTQTKFPNAQSWTSYAPPRTNTHPQSGASPGPRANTQQRPRAQAPSGSSHGPRPRAAPYANTGAKAGASAGPNTGNQTGASTRPMPAAIPTVPGFTTEACRQMEANLRSFGLKPQDLYQLHQDATWHTTRMTLNNLLLKYHPDKLINESAETQSVGERLSQMLNESKSQLTQAREALIKMHGPSTGN
jgi:hypothetical protein